jgi:hypothetical protein
MYTQRAVRPAQSFRTRDLWRLVLSLDNGSYAKWQACRGLAFPFRLLQPCRRVLVA